MNWTTKGGRTIPIRGLSDAHLASIIGMLERNGMLHAKDLKAVNRCWTATRTSRSDAFSDAVFADLDAALERLEKSNINFFRALRLFGQLDRYEALCAERERRETMRSSSDGLCWIGERPVYPGHPATCALILLRAYKGELEVAGELTEHGWLRCEGELDTPTAGGHLSTGLHLIKHVVSGTMSVEEAFSWGDARWVGAGGHRQYELPGQEQADRMKEALRAELSALIGKVDPDSLRQKEIASDAE